MIASPPLTHDTKSVLQNHKHNVTIHEDMRQVLMSAASVKCTTMDPHHYWKSLSRLHPLLNS